MFVKLDNIIFEHSLEELNKELKQHVITCENNIEDAQIFNLNNHLSMHAETILLSLEHSINHNDIEVFYQPCIKDGKIVAVETLLRFKYKEYLFPPLVIQIVKEKELYVDLSKVII